MGFPYSSGDVLTAADLNAIGSPLTYTPFKSNFTVSSESVQYYVVNKLVFVRFYFVVSGVSGTPSFTVPSGFIISGFPNLQTCHLLEAGVTRYQGAVMFASATSVSLSSINTSGSFAQVGAINNLSPFSWGAGDVISGGFWYQAV